MVKNIVIITQARVGSTRFPEKVLQPLGGQSMLAVHLKRLKQSKLANKIIVATTFEDKANEIVKISKNEHVSVYQGSTSDVLDRFYQAVKLDQPEYIVRVTSDCPLIDAILIDQVIQMALDRNLDYVANILKEEYPDGQDVEVFTFKALEAAWEKATLNSDREHVTPYIRRNSSFLNGSEFKSANLDCKKNYNHIRMTVDEPEDLVTVQHIMRELGDDKDWHTYTQYIIENYKILSNQSIIRNEGFIKSLNNDLKL
jgi:spore coat polysaccharide biosynthesis protein SpsF